MPWYVYVIECAGGSLYTGIAVDVAKRYAAHVSGKGARYTRSYPPQRVMAVIEQPDRSSALKTEHAIKRLSPEEKHALCLRLNPLPTQASAELPSTTPFQPIPELTHDRSKRKRLPDRLAQAKLATTSAPRGGKPP
jgi:putative endonuclease